MTWNIFEYQYDFVLISLCVLKNKIFRWNWMEKWFLRRSEGGGGGGGAMAIFVLNHVLCRTMYFCVEQGIFVLNKCYNHKISPVEGF